MLSLLLLALAVGATDAMMGPGPTMSGDELWACLLRITGSSGPTVTTAQIDAGLAATVEAGCRIFFDSVTGADIVAACGGSGGLARNNFAAGSYCNVTLSVSTAAVALCQTCMPPQINK